MGFYICIIGGKVAYDQTAIALNNYVSDAYVPPETERAGRTTIELPGADRLKDQFYFRTKEAIASLAFIRSD